MCAGISGLHGRVRSEGAPFRSRSSGGDPDEPILPDNLFKAGGSEEPDRRHGTILTPCSEF